MYLDTQQDANTGFGLCLRISPISVNITSNIFLKKSLCKENVIFMKDLRFSYLLGYSAVQSVESQRRSGEYVASVFRVDEYRKQEGSVKADGKKNSFCRFIISSSS
jgi:hypothetical protein